MGLFQHFKIKKNNKERKKEKLKGLGKGCVVVSVWLGSVRFGLVFGGFKGLSFFLSVRPSICVLRRWGCSVVKAPQPALLGRALVLACNWSCF